MPTETLVVIELVEGRPRVVLDKQELPLMQREGDTDYRCGSCETVLVEQVWPWELRNVVFRCPSCQSYNEIAK